MGKRFWKSPVTKPVELKQYKVRLAKLALANVGV